MAVDYDAIKEALAADINQPMMVQTDAGMVQMGTIKERWEALKSMEQDALSDQQSTTKKHPFKMQLLKFGGTTRA